MKNYFQSQFKLPILEITYQIKILSSNRLVVTGNYMFMEDWVSVCVLSVL